MDSTTFGLKMDRDIVHLHTAHVGTPLTGCGWGLRECHACAQSVPSFIHKGARLRLGAVIVL